MQYRPLGRTGVEVSVASLGTGGPSVFGQKAGMSFADQDALVHEALDLGINLFDTSPVYRESEAILGKALADVARDRYLIATKVSTDPKDYGDRFPMQDDVVASCERSLQRLGVDTIDIFQFHAVLPDRYQRVVDELYPAAMRLREQGKIRLIGLTGRVPEARSETIHLALTEAPELWDTVMLKYGILNQAAKHEVLPLCEQHGVGVLNMAAIRVKLPRSDELAGLIEEWTERNLIAPGELDGENSLGWLVRDHVTSVIGAGYTFAADHPTISTVITGTSQIAHLRENVAALNGPPLPASDKQRLEELFGALAEPV